MERKMLLRREEGGIKRVVEQQLQQDYKSFKNFCSLLSFVVRFPL